MNLKEFDAKQFLLEKGERVGLGIALTLMVLMLIFSLFMPSKGFFSGSPGAKAEALTKDTKTLNDALGSRQPRPEDLPDKSEGRLIALDTKLLRPDNYQILAMFEPSVKESPNRRPPSIYNIVEGTVADAHILIDTYMFNQDFTKIWVLRDPDRRQPNNTGGPGGKNAFSGLQGGGMPPGMPGTPSMQGQIAKMRRNMGNTPGGVRDLSGPGTNEITYDPVLISLDNWNSQELTARQPRPLRVAVIGGSFPYRRQLEEFRKQLRLADINAVLNDEQGEKEGKAFWFVGVLVERVEVDASGKKIGQWTRLGLAEVYEEWLKRTYFPFEPEDPKYNVVKFDGLVAPLLRTFHPSKKVDPTMRSPGMMMSPGSAGALGRRGEEPEEPAPSKSPYPDVAAKLPKIRETLDKLSNVSATLIAAPKASTNNFKINPFRPYAPPPADAQEPRNTTPKETKPDENLTIPEYALVRLVDVDLEPGKRYRYRLKIVMNNPNYKRKDVASPAYKTEQFLESREWFEIPQTASLPPELYYYAVDEKKGTDKRDWPKKESARFNMWNVQGPRAEQVVFQFHRWVESVMVKDDQVPVGEWAVADRVFVSRGEYVGRKVRIDLPIWKYMQDAIILPAEKVKGVSLRRQTTGMDVDFGFDRSPKDDFVLVDFEGGRVQNQSPKLDDTCRTEVLMLAPDGTLRARNSARDTVDEKRIDRRKEVLDRIEKVREGKSVD